MTPEEAKAREIREKIVDRLSKLPVINSGVAMLKYWLQEENGKEDFDAIIAQGLREWGEKVIKKKHSCHKCGEMYSWEFWCYNCSCGHEKDPAIGEVRIINPKAFEDKNDRP